MRRFKAIRKQSTFDFIKTEDQDFFYSLLKSYYFRRVLRDVLFIQKISEADKNLIREKWGKVTDEYIAKIEELGILRKKNGLLIAQFSLSDMGTIFEWFIAKYLSEELSLETMVDVKLKNLEFGGDIDVVARVGTKLIMIECKESPPNNISVAELKSILDRVNYLKPDGFILLIDTTLSIKRNILDNIKWILQDEPQKCREGVFKVKGNYYIITAKRNILQNLAVAINLVA
ncbi:MAG: hypothetical protein J7J57_01780 [Caldisericaceae bacterium]|nr:hypothetical protein [Caldisericaceae bacterium]